jgi:hypothetical protein
MVKKADQRKRDQADWAKTVTKDNEDLEFMIATLVSKIIAKGRKIEQVSNNHYHKLY